MGSIHNAILFGIASILVQPWFECGCERISCMNAPASQALFPPVATLSDESGDEVPAQKPGAKRRKPKGQRQLPVDDGLRIRSMLGNPKCHCKHKCLLQFTGPASFQELEKFRKDWAGLHKLDQDTVEP